MCKAMVRVLMSRHDEEHDASATRLNIYLKYIISPLRFYEATVVAHPLLGQVPAVGPTK